VLGVAFMAGLFFLMPRYAYEFLLLNRRWLSLRQGRRAVLRERAERATTSSAAGHAALRRRSPAPGSTA